MKTKFLVLFCILLKVQMAYAQSEGIRGKVTDGRNPLPGVSVKIKNAKAGTSTDMEGTFRLTNLTKGENTIIISAIGYQTIETTVVVSGSTVNIDTIRLSSNEVSLGAVVIRGTGSMRASEAKALNMKKTSNRIVDVIAADGIGKLPDRNAGEAVQRIPGVVLERDQGEGRFISVRGLPAQWSSATINGDRIPTAEEQTTSRSTAFDFFPSELIQFVEVSKALTPDLEGDAMGGNVNFITRTSVERKTFDLSLGGGYNQLAHKGAYSGNILYGDRTQDKKLGFVINGTLWNRNWATDNFEPRFAGNGKNISRMELRDYFGKRRTIGVNAAADYKLSANSKLYVRGMYGSLNDAERHDKLRLRYDNNRAEAQSISNILKTRLLGGDIGGDFVLGDRTTLDFKISRYDNDFSYGNIPNKDFPSYYIVQYNQTNVGYTNLQPDGKSVAYQIDGGDIDPTSPATHLPGQSAVMDASKYTFNSVQMELHHINETDRLVAQFNIKNKLSSNFEIKAGLKYRDKLRTERYELPTWVWDSKGGTQPPPTYVSLALEEKPYANTYLKNVGSQFVGIFPKFLNKNELEGFFDKYRNNLVVDSVNSSLLANGVQTGSNYQVYEKHTAAYVMGTWNVSDQLAMIGGLRAERTDLRVDGYLYETVAGQPSFRGKLTPQTKYNDYTVLLPMVHVKYSPEDNLNLRLAATKTFARPDFGSLVAGGSYLTQENRFVYGNPSLMPVKSYNLDVMGEYFFGNVGALTAGAFYKNVKDPIFKATQTYAEFNGKTDVRVLQDQNGSDAYVAGFELGLQRKLDFLPGFFSGFGINTNYTFMRSRMQITDRSDKVRIPGQANSLINVALFYENNLVQARVALNSKGASLTTAGANADADEYFGKNTSMDANFSIRITKKIQLFAEANNLLNTKYILYLGRVERPSQVEYYGIRGQAGIRINIY